MNNEETLPKYVIVENNIKEAIRQGVIDDKLPGERVLAKEFGFSYMTVRKAVENLVADGVLYRIPTRGTYVADQTDTTEVKKDTRNIGYFLDSSIREGLSSPYYSLIFNALEKEAAKNDFALVYFSNIDETNLLKNMEKIDGAIVSNFPRVENILADLKQLVPVVTLDNRSPDESIPSVIIDNFKAVLAAVEYLCSIGHSKIGFFSGLDDSEIGINRLAGYKRALINNNIDVDSTLIYQGDYSFRSGAAGVEFMLALEDPPTAIMCANDTMAIGAISELSRKGFEVPGNISIVGFDDVRVASEILPALTTVAAPIEEIAEQSINMLNSLIKGISPENKHLILEARLAIRKSTAAIENALTNS